MSDFLLIFAERIERKKYCNMEEQVSIAITADTCFAPDFLRQLANEIEEREGEGNFSFKTENGIADIFY